MIAGFEEPSSGDISIDGQPVVDRPPYERGIGMVFQNYALFPHLTVAENIAFPLDLRGVDKTTMDRRVREVLDIVRLPDLGRRYPSQLSGGQQQRVALARAVVFEPRMVLMDEPLGALDRNLREQLKEEIRRIHRELGMTIVYVTHDQDEALVLSDRIAVMRNGRLEQISTAHDLYNRPVNRFVATFIGESNLLPFRAAAGGGIELACGVTVEAGKDAGGLAGGWLLVRPEAIDIRSGPGRITGVVRQAVYLGEVSRYIIEVGGERIVAKLQNRHGRSFAPSQEVSLSWNPADSAILTD
jgi:putative spermidine/putrescine transport system ATP-binding protein